MPSSAERNNTLAAAIAELRRQHGSHDRLAAALGTSRQRIIDWERGAYPRDYMDALIRLGVPADLFQRTTIEELRQRLVTLEREAAELRRLLEAHGRDGDDQ